MPEVLTDPRIVLLVSAWPSSHGGIETVNRELAKALVKLGETVVCLVDKATKEDIEDAAKSGVLLIRGRFTRAPNHGAYLTDVVWPSELPWERVRLIVGHSKFTGRAANALRDRLNAKASPNMAREVSRSGYFVHMDVRQLRYLENLPAAQRDADESLEIDGISKADIVFAMGPLLRDVASDLLRSLGQGGKEVTMVTGGMDPEAQVLPIRQRPSIAVIGRLALQVDDPQELRLNEAKGVDLALAAYAELLKLWPGYESPPPLELIGVQPELEQPLVQAARRRVEKISERRNVRVVITPFAADAAEVNQAFARASLLLMPSLAEGYGLVALEALSRGIPILLSGQSGVAQLMRENLSAHDVSEADCFIDTDLKKAASRLAKRISTALHHPTDEHKRQMKLRNGLLSIASWAVGAQTILDTIDGSSKDAQAIRSCRQWVRTLSSGLRRFFPSPENWAVYREIGTRINESDGTDRSQMQNRIDCFGYLGWIASLEGQFNTKAGVDRVEIEGVTLSGYTLKGVFIDTDFLMVDLRDVKADNKTAFFYCSWDNVQADGAHFLGSRFEHCRWRSVTMRNGDLSEARFKYLACDGLNLVGTDLDGSIWEFVHFSRVTLGAMFGTPVWDVVSLVENPKARSMSSSFDNSFIWDNEAATPIPSGWKRERAENASSPYDENFTPGRFGHRPDPGEDLFDEGTPY